MSQISVQNPNEIHKERKLLGDYMVDNSKGLQYGTFDCVKSHIRLQDGIVVPIKIIPLCKVENKQLTIGFLLDRLNDTEFGNYKPEDIDPDLNDPNNPPNIRRNLPLLSSNGDVVYTYESHEDNDQLLALNVTQNFTLPYFSGNGFTLETDKKKFNNLLKFRCLKFSIPPPVPQNPQSRAITYIDLVIPKFTASQGDLQTLGVSLFKFILE